jgi:hypothetical protein
MSTLVNILLSIGTFIDWILAITLLLLVLSVMPPLYHYINHEQTIDE